MPLGLKGVGTHKQTRMTTQFGVDLPARIPNSNGTEYFVSTTGNDSTGDGSISNPWLTIQKAFDTVPLSGSIINLRSGTYDQTASDLTWSRNGSPTNPVTLRNYPGETAIIRQNATDRQLQVTGTYLRIKGEPTASSSRLQITASSVADSRTGIKCSGGADHIDIDGLHIFSLGNQGILLGGNGNIPNPADATNIQIWNSRVNTIGDVTANQNHGMYLDNVDQLVVANCLIYDNFAWGIQAYPAVRNAIITCCTIDDHPNASAMIYGDTVAQNTTFVGLACTNNSGSGFNAVQMPGANGNYSGNNYYDCLAWNVTAPPWPSKTGVTYTNCSQTLTDPKYSNAATRDYTLLSGSPLINLAVSRPGLVPATDLLGRARVTADAGCFRF